jgi:ribulose-bisphosphate carboxylase large chain
VQARNEGRDFVNEGPQILEEAAKHSKALANALGIWKDITFDYASTDSPDVVATPSY